MKLHALVGLVVILFAVLVDAVPGDAARGTRRQCRQTCGPRIAQDCGAFRKAARRACRRAILRSCRRVALESCFLTPAPTVVTTTTTSLAAATTTQPVSTTTQFLPTTTQDRPTTTISTSTTKAPTTSQPPTTTTTLPFDYGGDWTFFGDLIADTCNAGEPPFFDVDVFVSHVPGDSEIGVAVDPFPVAFGTADRDGFDADRAFLDSDCIISVAFAAEVTSNPDLMIAAFVVRSACLEGTCTVAYAGDLER